MKKGLLGLLVIALTVVGCQNYDDQFDDLNKKISDLATTVGGLETVQTAITTLGSKLDALSSSALTDSDLAQVLTEVANVKAAVAEIKATDVSGIEAEVADLDTEVAQILEKLGELLSQNSVIPGNLVIANLGDLAAAQELIKTKADDPLVTIQGNVHISITANNGLKDSIAAVNAITAKLKIVQSTATITTVSGGAVALPELMYINGSYAASGAGGVSAPKLRTINGSAAIDTGGAVSYPLLSSAGSVMISQTNTVTSVDFSGLSSGAVLTGTKSLTLPNATSVKVGGVLPEIVHLAKATEFVSSYSGAAQTTSTITVGGAAATFSLASTKFTGQVTLTTTGDANLSGITEAGALHVDAASINLSGITKFTGATTLSATTVDISAMKSSTNTVTLVGPTSVSLPALTSLGGDFVAVKAASFSAPLLATSTGTINVKAAATIDLLSLTATTTIKHIGDITGLTLRGQKVTVDLTDFVNVVTLDYTGAHPSSITPGSHGTSNNLNITSALASLTTLNIGNGGIGSLTVSASTLKSLVTKGHIITTVVHNNTNLESFDFGHSHADGDDATTIDITGNTNSKLTSIDLSSLAKVKHVNITGNTSLTTITAPSASVLAEPLATVTLTISGNDTVGTYTSAVSATETTVFVPTTATAAVVTAFKPFISAYLAQTRTASVTFSINVDKVDDDADGAYDDGDMQTIMAADAAGINGPDGTAGNADDITNGTGGVDTAKELALF